MTTVASQNKERAGKSRWAERGEFLPFQVSFFFQCFVFWHLYLMVIGYLGICIR